jgi:hypothetical protein
MTTPTLQELIKTAFDHEIANIHTALPGHIVKYDAATQKAEVKPNLQKKYYNGAVQDMPIITNVPIVFPRSSEAFFKFPLKVNDGVLLIFSERSLERWLSLGGVVEPGASRKFDISDCIAIPGLFSFASPIPDSSDNLIIQYKNAKYVINNNNKLALGNDSEEFIALIIDFIEIIQNPVFQFGGDSLNGAGISLLNTLKSRINTIKGEL